MAGRDLMVSRSGLPIRLALCVLTLLLIVAILLVAVGLAGARATPVMREARIGLTDWPEASSPIRLALISDIHMGGHGMSPDRLAALVQAVNAARPDVVVLAGDFVSGHQSGGTRTQAAALTSPLMALRAPGGVFAVLGNHDYWTDPRAVTQALESADVVVLDNTARLIGPMVLVGVSDSFSGHARETTALRSTAGMAGPRVVLTHSPDLANRLGSEVSLVLAGHTHCGQIVLPLVGSIVSRSPKAGFRSLYDPRYRCGLVRDQTLERTVVVTAGVGSGSLPLRIGAAPDWWLLELGPARPRR